MSSSRGGLTATESADGQPRPPGDPVGVLGCSHLNGKSLWLAIDPEPVYGVFHAPDATGQARTAALILPPFGVDLEFSYRPCRDWAIRLAEAGVATLRIDYPGTEDSVGSPLARGRFDSWVNSVIRAAAWLRDRTGCERLVGIGLGLGGFLSHQAILAGAPIDDLVFWGVRWSGRAYLRELKTFAAVANEGVLDPPADAEGTIWLAGHAMSAETAAALRSVDFAKSPLPDAPLRRALLIGRNAGGADDKLRLSLEASGARVTVLDAGDSHRMTVEPEFQWSPTEMIEASIAWLKQPELTSPGPTHPTAYKAPEVLQSVNFQYEGAEITEELSTLVAPTGRICGIVSRPRVGVVAPFCLIIINSGALRHTGPSRMFVEVARRAAAHGVPAARFDLPGLGDSDGTWVRSSDRTVADDRQIVDALKLINDHLVHTSVSEQFVDVGLCTGGYLALRAALEDERTVGVIAANPPILEWNKAVHRRSMRWFRAMSGPVGVESEDSSARSLFLRLRRGRLSSAQWRLVQRLAAIDLLWRIEYRRELFDAPRILDRLGGSGAGVYFLMGENESLLRLFEQRRVGRRFERWPSLRLERLPTRDHSLRPVQIQRTFFDLVADALTELWSDHRRI